MVQVLTDWLLNLPESEIEHCSVCRLLCKSGSPPVQRVSSCRFHVLLTKVN